ncbi:formate dehydrogenase accessory sulfurtransferase FdhD [Cytobacillus dafuensis]|uniref:Formate dehydrogenase accessory sulfurtransferase FdhD n=1 Tax=Cytobacillus dafuensis TaxID=1742359 RepID=A0A5B8ZAA4_CYTDA|nr:formate dehydrogenase accessory sulfurtransferase FdhD [Cytobacillus dafuensis]QED49787.1 formate dehydrogenase accessory sulfurtransferase FdhD [Cytobacillus dafuensis]
MNKKGCPEEFPITLRINGYEMAVFQLTNHDLEDWAYGYLFSEGMIASREDIRSIHYDETTGILEVSLKDGFDPEIMFSKKKHYTAGCGRGVTFFSMTDVKTFSKVQSEKTYLLSYILKKRSEFAKNSPLYAETGGMHGACIVHANGEITVREDIGRHNAVDKIIGHAIRTGCNPKELLLLTTGRVSYEMLSKAAKFGFAVIGSRTAATKQAIQLAKFLNVEVVGYLRGRMAIPYTSFGRVINDLEERI